MKKVPSALRKWFVVHFIVDMLFAIPLMIAPVYILTLFGWGTIDPIMARVVAAALFGIGIESWLGRNESIESLRVMLNLKIIWSGAVIVGLLWTLFEGARFPLFAWLVLVVFVLFHALWWYWRRRV